jgi:hypothetical protein
MPQMQLNRDLLLRSKFGFSVAFTAGTACHVPSVVVPEASAIGAVLIDGDDVLTVQPKEPELPVGEARKQAIIDTMLKMTAEGNRDSFDSQGRPSRKVLKTLLGFPVELDERNEIWDSLQSTLT